MGPMPMEMGMWRIDGDLPKRLMTATLPSEATLEAYLEQDPSLLGERLLVIGRQVRTAYNKFIDLLAMDQEGNLHVLELKRDKTPREVVAQALDYGSWVSTLDRDSIIDLARDHLNLPFEVAFEEVFGISPPDELNAAQQLTIVATELDSSSERIVTYLRTFGVPINAVFFCYYEDEARRYLARTWLARDEDNAAGGAVGGSAKKGKRAEWNGRDWFVSFGQEVGGRAWQDAQDYGFISAGGGPWYSRTLRELPVGARVNVHIPQRGYVAIGETTGPARRFDSAIVTVDGVDKKLDSLPLKGTYGHGDGELSTDDQSEWVVPVKWFKTSSESDAYWEKGMFANQNSACKLRQEFTLERLAQHFKLAEQDA